MELKNYIRIEMEISKKQVERVIQGLSQAELAWRPACGCNPIGLILFHITRGEDDILCAAQNTKEVWETGKWYQKFNRALTDNGSGYDVDQVNAFQVPPLKDMLDYWDAVRSRNLKWVENLTPNQLDKKITMPHFGEVTAGDILAISISHTAQHTGEMSYIRGIQRGLNK